MSGYATSSVGILHRTPPSLVGICFEVEERKFRIIGNTHVLIFVSLSLFFLFLIFKINSYSVGWKDFCGPVWTVYVV